MSLSFRNLILLTPLMAAYSAAQQPPPQPTQPPFRTAPLETVRAECQNGRQGGLSMFETSGVLTISASFGQVDECDSVSIAEQLPFGACEVRGPQTEPPTASTGRGEPSSATPITRSLDVGPHLTLRTPTREIRVPRLIFGPSTFYTLTESRRLSTEERLNPNPANLTIQPGRYTLSAEGGRDLPSFSEEFEVTPFPITVTRPAGTIAAPAQSPANTPLSIEWRGGDGSNGPGSVSVSIFGAAGAASQYGITCSIRDLREGRFTIPEAAWNAVPAAARGGSFAAVSVTGGFQQRSISVPGVDTFQITVPLLSISSFQAAYATLTP